MPSGRALLREPSRRGLLRAVGPAALAGLAGCSLLDSGPSYPVGTVVFDNRDDRYHEVTLRAAMHTPGGEASPVIHDRNVEAGDRDVVEGLLGPADWTVTVEVDGERVGETPVSLPDRRGDGPYLYVGMTTAGGLVLERRE